MAAGAMPETVQSNVARLIKVGLGSSASGSRRSVDTQLLAQCACLALQKLCALDMKMSASHELFEILGTWVVDAKEARPARILFLCASVCAAPTLNTAGKSRVTLSLR